MTVPERLQMTQDLALMLETGEVKVTPTIFMDNTYQGVWWNARRAWSSARGDYHMVIQDDCLPNFPQTFLMRLHPLLSILQDHYILTLFDISNSHIREAAIKMGKGLLKINRVTVGQATVMSRTNVFKFLKWVETNIPYDAVEPGCDDERIAEWQLANAVPALLPIPYMVDHSCGSRDSTIGNHHPRPRSILPIDDGHAVDTTIYRLGHKITASLRFNRAMAEAKSGANK